MDKKLVVVGCGSIGKRHLRNCRATDVRHLRAVDVRDDRRAEVERELNVPTYATLESALEDGPADGVIAALPTAFHLPVARQALDAGCHVLIEKPIGDEPAGFAELIADAKKRNLAIMVGYSYRFWPPLQYVRELLGAQAIGRVYSAQMTFSEYLPDWHPWEDYRSWFMARKEDGGGALLDESHTVDIARWFFGEVATVFCNVGQYSHLEISADDLAEMLVTFESGVVASIHMDIFGRDHRKHLEIIGEKGNVSWDFYRNDVKVYDADSGESRTRAFKCDRNQMFVDEIRHFLACIAGEAAPPVDGHDGLRTLHVLAAARESHAAERLIRLSSRHS